MSPRSFKKRGRGEERILMAGTARERGARGTASPTGPRPQPSGGVSTLLCPEDPGFSPSTHSGWWLLGAECQGQHRCHPRCLGPAAPPAAASQSSYLSFSACKAGSKEIDRQNGQSQVHGATPVRSDGGSGGPWPPDPKDKESWGTWRAQTGSEGLWRGQGGSRSRAGHGAGQGRDCRAEGRGCR